MMQMLPHSLARSHVTANVPCLTCRRGYAAGRRVRALAAQQQQQQQHAVKEHALQHAGQHIQDYMTQRHETVLEYFPSALGEQLQQLIVMRNMPAHFGTDLSKMKAVDGGWHAALTPSRGTAA
jgi:ATP/maltotriose-dependent transcriptional regulator MalT